jgi:hypothetical protein
MKFKIQSPFVVPAQLHARLVIARVLYAVGVKIQPKRTVDQLGAPHYGYSIHQTKRQTGLERRAWCAGWTFAEAVQEAMCWLTL